MRKLWQLLINAVSFFVFSSTARPTNEESVNLWEHVNKTCLTHVCDEEVNLQHLRDLQDHMNSAADPCINFHEYACGNWPQVHKDSSSMMKVADGKLTKNYMQLFEKWLRTPPERGQNVVVDKMLKYYQVCKESEQKGKLKFKGYFESLRSEGPWHVQDFDWIETLAALGRFGFTGLLLHLEAKQQNSTHHVLALLQADLEKVQLEDEIYQDVLREFTKIDQETLLSEFERLETELKEILRSNVERNEVDGETEEDDEVDFIAFGKFKMNEPDLQRLFNLQLGRTVHDSEIVVVESLVMARNIVQYFNRVDKKLLLLYTVTKFLNYIKNIPYSILNIGASSNNCIKHLRKTLSIPMMHVYEDSYYGPMRDTSDPIIHAVFQQLKKEFANRLKQNKMLLPNMAVDFLLQKLSRLRINLGNIPENVTQQFYEDYLRELNVTENFYSNHLNSLRHSYKQLYTLTSEERSNLELRQWYSFSYHGPKFPDNLDETPYYFVRANMILIPHAYLQTPFYDQRFWPALLYGDLATTLGHELIHAFDTDFLAFDHLGNPADVYKTFRKNSKYRKNLECLEPGTQFLTERIADISGTRLALNTFMGDADFMKSNGRLYFLQLAQFFCGAREIELFKKEDPFHDMDSLRLNYTLAHMPEFAEVYNCPPGSPMNPARKCELW